MNPSSPSNQARRRRASFGPSIVGGLALALLGCSGPKNVPPPVGQKPLTVAPQAAPTIQKAELDPVSTKMVLDELKFQSWSFAFTKGPVECLLRFGEKAPNAAPDFELPVQHRLSSSNAEPGQITFCLSQMDPNSKRLRAILAVGGEHDSSRSSFDLPEPNWLNSIGSFTTSFSFPNNAQGLSTTRDVTLFTYEVREFATKETPHVFTLILQARLQEPPRKP